MTITATDPRLSASTAAARAIAHAGVDVREIANAADCARAAALLADVWRSDAPPVPTDLMRAVQHGGGYVFGAYDETGALQAVSLGFLAAAGLHSHITGVLPQTRRHGLGFALKQHQRSWALERGITAITWTCDPLVRRNVVFNLHALGAEVVDYLPNHYGAMRDGINAQDESDRFELHWDLTSSRTIACGESRRPYLETEAPAAVSSADDLPAEHPVSGRQRRVQLPQDIEALRGKTPAAGRAWRLAVRDAVVPALSQGARILGLTAAGELVLS